MIKPKIAIFLFCILIIFAYLLAIKDEAFLFSIYFPAASFITLILLLSSLIRIISSLKKKECSKTCRIRLKIIYYILFFFIGSWLINHFFLPDKFHPISIFGNLIIIIFTIFLTWGLIKQIEKKKLFTGFLLFIIIISILSFISSNIIYNPQQSSTEAIQSLPYLTWIPADRDIIKTGVIRNDYNSSEKDFNLYCLRNFSTAYLMDMKGNIFHSWSTPKNTPWHYVKMCKNGDLLGIVYQGSCTRLDWDSRIKWIKNLHFHHDITTADNDDIYGLTNKAVIIFWYGLPVPILNDYIIIMSPQGEIKKEISLYKVLKKNISLSTIIKIYKEILFPNKRLFEAIQQRNKYHFIKGDTVFDIFHNNTITIMDKTIPNLCSKGDILISVREFDYIGILNIKSEKLIWSWGQGILSRQHHPTLLKNGNILIFDNGRKNGYSRIVELNPLNKKIEWEYKASPPERFFSPIGGGCQRLANGNTLITEEYKGRVFEITPEGKTVWEFYTPYGENRKTRAAIYRMTRLTLPNEFFLNKK